MPSTLGSVTKNLFENHPEAHKLTIEFQVATGQTVKKADPVILAAAGTVQLAGTAAPAYTLIGVSITENAIAGEFVSIAMKAYCVVWGEAAAASLNAGAVQLGAYNSTTGYREYAAVAGADDDAKDVVAVGHNLTQVTADGDLVKVALLL